MWHRSVLILACALSAVACETQRGKRRASDATDGALDDTGAITPGDGDTSGGGTGPVQPDAGGDPVELDVVGGQPDVFADLDTWSEPGDIGGSTGGDSASGPDADSIMDTFVPPDISIGADTSGPDTSGSDTAGGTDTTQPTVADLESCGDILTCAVACAGDSACQQNCMGLAGAGEQQQFQDFVQCEADYCSGLSGGAFSECVQANCLPSLYECLGAGTLTCQQLFGCLAGCASDQTCVDVCFENGSPAGVQQRDAVTACFAEVCGPNVTNACAQQSVESGGQCEGVFAMCQ